MSRPQVSCVTKGLDQFAFKVTLYEALLQGQKLCLTSRTRPSLTNWATGRKNRRTAICRSR